MNRSVRISLFILILGILLSTFLRLSVVWNFNFPFTIDQGRDMLDIRHMVYTYTPRLVGPTTSINGVLLGPAWYYFLLPAFLLGSGSPTVVVYWQILWYELAGFALWLVFSKRDEKLGLIAGLLFLFMPVGFNTNRFFWNANAMLIFTAFFFAGFYAILRKTTAGKLFLLGLLAGIGQQIEAAFGILLFPFALVYFILKKRKTKDLTALTGGFLLTLIPQLLFELRHHFIMTKVLIAQFGGQNSILGVSLDFSKRMADRWANLIFRITQLSHSHPDVIKLIVFLSMLYLLNSVFIYRKRSPMGKFFFPLLLFLLFCAVFYMLFPQPLKDWYTFGIEVPLILIVSGFVYSVSNSKIMLLKILAWSFVILDIYFAYVVQMSYFKTVASKPSGDPSNMKNELQIIDYVYKKANGSPFKVYTYLPGIYDLNYNYLYWWYGTRKYGYQPSDTAYLPDQTEYIQDNSLFWTKTKNFSSSDPTFLVIDGDTNDFVISWLGHFAKLCQTDEVTFPFSIHVMEMNSCHE